jgi:hypothetical protein
MTRDEAIRRVREAPADPAVAGQRAVAVHEAPARDALVVRERGEERTGSRVVERKHRESPAVDPDGDPRRPAAEPSARVVEENGPVHALGYAPEP